MGKELEKNVARLESKLDLLESELYGLDLLLKQGGFKNGVETLKKAVHELLGRVDNNEDLDEYDDLFD